MPIVSASDIPLRLALADIPDFKTASPETKQDIRNTMRDCIRTLGSEEDMYLNLFRHILEGEHITQRFWSMPNNLIYDPISWIAKDDVIRPYNLGTDVVAADGLLELFNPEELSGTVEQQLSPWGNGEWVTVHCVLSPPTFIRFLWDNTEWVYGGGKLRPGELSTFNIRVQDAHFENGQLSHPIVTASYRLACLARCRSKDGQPVSAHYHMPDGHSFFPRTDGKLSQYWSCTDPGSYYLVYQKSHESRLEGSSGQGADDQQSGLIVNVPDPAETPHANQDPPHPDSHPSESAPAQLAKRPKARNRLAFRHHPHRYSL